jgi:hypothetical protein
VGHTQGVFRRRRSLGSRLFDLVPVLALVCVGAAGVFTAMQILVTAAPVVMDLGTPGAGSSRPSFGESPSPGSFDPGPSETPYPTASLPNFKPTIVKPAIDQADPGKAWTVYLKFPQFMANTTPWASEMNAMLRSEMEDKALSWETGPAGIKESGVVHHLTGDFTIDILTSSLASFTLTWEDDTIRERPARGADTIAFDLSTGQPIPFDTIFIDTQAALKLISAESDDQLYYLLGTGYNKTVVTDGLRPIMPNFGDWSITPTGIKVSFSQYQVDTGGKLYFVVVPWELLRPVMALDGPVADYVFR